IREPQADATPLTRFRKKARLPKLWPTMPGHVFFVRCATKESATPVIAMRTVSQRVGCMNKWKTDQRIPWITHVALPNARSWHESTYPGHHSPPPPILHTRITTA